MKKTLQFFLCITLLFFSLTSSAQPANDNCADAMVITEGDNQAFTTVDASSDGAAHADDCASSGTTPDSTYNDVWYSYTASFTGQAEWTFCGTANYDTKIYVYGTGAMCPPTDSDIIGCSEDAPGCADATSAATFDVTMGETYLLRVGGYGDGGPGESGSGTFNLSEFISNAPDNDDCANAAVIMLGAGQAVDNTDATTDGPEHPNNPCFGFGDNTIQSDIWYSFTSPITGSVQWSTCNLVNFDSRLGVYPGSIGCPFSDADLLACNDDGGGCDAFTSSLIFDVVMGETYLLRLGGYDGEMGSGTMDLLDIIPPDPPANDLCSNPESVFVMTPQQADDDEFEFSGTTIAAGFDSDAFLFPKCIGNTNGGEFADVWYTFDPQGLDEVELRFLTFTADATFYFDLWEDCDSLAMAPVMEDCFFIDGAVDPVYTDTIISIPPTQNLYYIRISTRLTSDIPGDFIFQLVGDVIDKVEELTLTELRFYPNPVNDIGKLEFELPKSDDIQIEIIDILGQRVYFEDKGKLSAGAHNYSFNLDIFSQGIYFLTVRSDEQVKSLKFIKE